MRNKGEKECEKNKNGLGPGGHMVLDVAQSIGINIPALCRGQDLTPPDSMIGSGFLITKTTGHNY
jgi:hypothetical protein